MIVSVETPVFKGKWLRRCIDSVLGQTSPNWHLSLVWDGGDEESRLILEELAQRKLDNVTVHFCENRGIARARQYLSQQSRGDFILPLDDDDVLPLHTVERFLEVAREKPWASVIRGRRLYIDESGTVVDMDPWFPFEQRHYQHGMVTDLFNHSQPYLIRRSAFDQTSGWEGFEDFMFAGEDCDIYLKLEEQGTIELLDEVLYYYRINPDRASDTLTPEGAFEMWRRLADKTIARIGLPLRRTNETMPFEYEYLDSDCPGFDDISFVITCRDGKNQLPDIAERLKQQGASDDAIYLTSGDVSELGKVLSNLASSDRSHVCLMSASDSSAGRKHIEYLLEKMHELRTDLVTPWQHGASWPATGVTVIRRQVLNAVGGLDDGFDQQAGALIDLCLKTRQREFRCDHPDASQGDTEKLSEQCMQRLQRKWADYPALLERL